MGEVRTTITSHRGTRRMPKEPIGIIHVIVPEKLENWVATLIRREDGQPGENVVERRRLKRERDGLFGGETTVRATFPRVPCHATLSYRLQIDDGGQPPQLAEEKHPSETYSVLKLHVAYGHEVTYDFRDQAGAPVLPPIIE